MSVGAAQRAISPIGISWAQHIDAHAPPPPPQPALPTAGPVGSQGRSREWFVVDSLDCLPSTEGVWCMAWSRADKLSKLDFVNARLPMIQQFLTDVSGNSDWPCPLCFRPGDVGIDHFTQLKHLTQVWHALDKANDRLGMAKGTYTDRAYGFAELWSFKPCQPSHSVECTAAVSLLDGQYFLLARGSLADFVGPNGWVTFLPHGAPEGSVLPTRVSLASLRLPLEYEPVRAG